MVTKCSECPLRALDRFLPFSDQDVRFMEKFKVGELEVAARTTFLTEGSSSRQLYTVLRGLGLRYKLLPNGRRQVLNFIYPGDFVGLQAALLGEMKHSADATTRMTLCVFDRKEFAGLFRHNPDRAFDVTWLAAVEEHFLGGAISTLGQREGRARLAWALTRIYYRSKSLGLLDGDTVEFPFKQQDLADALGLSLVHTNKTLAKFRAMGLIDWLGPILTFHDIRELENIAMTDAEEHTSTRPLM